MGGLALTVPSGNTISGSDEAPAQQRGDRVRHRDMGDAAVAEEARTAQIGAVLELIDHHEHARIEIAVERSTGGNSDDVGDANPFQRIDIGAVIDGRRREAMPAAVASEEHRLRLPNASEA